MPINLTNLNILHIILDLPVTNCPLNIKIILMHEMNRGVLKYTPLVHTDVLLSLNVVVHRELVICGEEMPILHTSFIIDK